MSYFNDLLNGTTGVDGWVATALSASSVTYNGQRQYTIIYSSSVASTLSSGMRLRVTRDTASPTQCTDLESGSSQYFNRTSGSVAGMTFTDDFTVSAWIKLESYTGVDQVIASRFNGTSGWEFKITNDGRVSMVGYNASAANFSYVRSYQAIPLGVWVHVSAQLDMSAFTATTTTSYTMIDGVNVPAFVTRGGTNPTALVQAGNLEVGSRSGGTESFFDGKIAQLAIFNAKITQSTLVGYISQGLSGSETSLISAYSFNNSLADLSANANTLTANNGAVATSADSPFGDEAVSSTLDYALITSVSASTITVQVPAGCTIPTSGTINSFAYSSTTSPYGWVINRARWSIRSLSRTQYSQAASINTWYNVGSYQLSVPVGAFELGYQCDVQSNAAGLVAIIRATLSTGASTESDVEMTSEIQHANSASANVSAMGGMVTRTRNVANSVATTYYFNLEPRSTASQTLYLRGDEIANTLYAIPAGL